MYENSNQNVFQFFVVNINNLFIHLFMSIEFFTPAHGLDFFYETIFSARSGHFYAIISQRIKRIDLVYFLGDFKLFFLKLGSN